MKIIRTIIVILCCLAGYLVVLFWWMKRPAQPITPRDVVRPRFARGEKLVVLLGDSLTEGRLSANYVLKLDDSLGNQGYQFVNAGVGGDLAWNLLRRIDAVIACQPDYIVVFVGTNDMQAASTPEKGRAFVVDKGLPQMPTDDWFRENLEQILIRLQGETEARIALVSLGFYGEDLDSPANERMQAYSKVIQETASVYGVDYLPLHETMREYLAARGDKERLEVGDGKVEFLLRWNLVFPFNMWLGKWNAISAANGFDLLTDGLHYNDTAAGLVAGLVKSWLESAAVSSK